MWVQYSLLSFRWLRWQACSPQKYCFKRNQRTKDVLIQGSPTGSWVKLLRNLSWKDINNPWTCSWCRELNSSPKTQDFFLGGGGVELIPGVHPQERILIPWSPAQIGTPENASDSRLMGGKIQKVVSHWGGPVLLTRKKHENLWQSLNYQQLDAWTVNNK